MLKTTNTKVGILDISDFVGALYLYTILEDSVMVILQSSCLFSLTRHPCSLFFAIESHHFGACQY